MTSDLIFSGGDRSAPLTIRTSPRAKTMRLRVDPRTGVVLLTIPRRVSEKKAVLWAAGHRDWVEEALARIPPSAAIGPGAILPFRGVPHVVDWDAGRPRSVIETDGSLRVGGPLEGLEARMLRWLRQQARTLLTAETHEFARLAGVSVSRVGVGDPVSRWGSCSASGAIRYSWRLILAPDFVRRATVAHEVAHRVHMDHGRAFHALVEDLLGTDPAPARRWLRSEGATVHRIGRGAA